MRRLKKWAVLLLAVTLAAGNMPTTYAQNASGLEAAAENTDSENNSNADAGDVDVTESNAATDDTGDTENPGDAKDEEDTGDAKDEEDTGDAKDTENPRDAKDEENTGDTGEENTGDTENPGDTKDGENTGDTGSTENGENTGSTDDEEQQDQIQESQNNAIMLVDEAGDDIPDEQDDLGNPYDKYFEQTDTSISPQDYINTYTGNPTAKLSFTKTWAVGQAPDENTTFSLKPKMGMITVGTGDKTKTTQLPASLKFEIKGYASTTSDDGTLIERDEVALAFYTVTLKPVYEPGKYSVEGSIECKDGDQKADTDAKPKIEVTIKEPTEDATTADWTVSISNLKSIAPDGSAIIYEVQETPVNGYQLTASGNDKMTSNPDESGVANYSGAKFTNTYSGKKFDKDGNGSYTYVQAEKIWEKDGKDGNDSWGRRPNKIDLYLYRSIEGNDHDQRTDYEVGTVSLNSTNSWKDTAGGTADNPTLLVYAPDGTEFDYYLIEGEDQAPSYEHKEGSCVYEDGVMTVTLTNTLPTGTIYFQKNWRTQLGSVASNMTGEEFDRLLALGALPTITITVQYYDDNTNVWTNLEKDGKPVQTTFSPDNKTEYKKLFTNRDTNRYTVPLYKEGENVAGQDGVNYQEYRIKETVKYSSSSSVDYYSTDVNATTGIHATDDGTPDIAAHTATLTNTISVQQVEIIKEWKDNQNQDGQRPGNLTITLKKNDSATDTTTVTAFPVTATTNTTLTDTQKSSGNYYSTGVILVPAESSVKAPAGFEVKKMSVTEADVPRYTATSGDPGKGSGSYKGVDVTTFTFTNVYAPTLFDISATKVWSDEGNKYGLRNTDGRIDLTLWYSLDNGSTWTTIQTAGKEQKKYYHIDGTNYLYYDGGAVYTTTDGNGVRISTKSSPTVTWENLPAKALVNGRSVEVLYKITEDDDNKAYTGSADSGAFDGTIKYNNSTTQSFTITNSLKTTSLMIQKEWKEEGTDRASYRPDSISFQVEYRAGNSGEWTTLPGLTNGIVTITKPEDASGAWKTELTGLPLCDRTGTDYQYRVSEVSLDYTTASDTQSDAAKNGVFDNTEKTWTGDMGRYLAKVTTTQKEDGSWTASAENTLIDHRSLFTIEVSKQWEDGENCFGLRPENNGVELSLQYSLDDGMNWSDITQSSLNWDNCYDDNYKAYTTSEPTQTAVAAGNGKAATPARWENLPAKVLVDGVSTEVKYRVTEPGLSAAYSSEIYTAKADGSIDQKTDQKAGTAWKGTASEVQKFVIVNTLNTVSLTVSKEWTGEDGVKGAEALRPEKIEVRLEYALSGDADTWKTLPAGTYRTGSGSTVEVGEDGLLTLTGKDGWETSLVGLRPYSEDGQTYSYRAQETKLIYQDGQSYTVQDADGGRYRVSGTTVQEKDGMFKSVLTNQLVDRYGARITKHALTLDGQVLQGADYVLYRPAQMDYYTGQDAEGNALWGIWNDAKILTTGEDGTVTVTGLPRGDYQFIEIAAAKGYRIDSTPVAFTIGDDNIGTLCEVHQADQKRSRGKHSSDRGHNSQAVVTDLQPVEPSRTGDTDDWRLYAGLAAGALLACGGYLLLRRRRRS